MTKFRRVIISVYGSRLWLFPPSRSTGHRPRANIIYTPHIAILMLRCCIFQSTWRFSIFRCCKNKYSQKSLFLDIKLWFIAKSEMSSLENVEFFQTFLHVVEFSALTQWLLGKTVVLIWKSTHSPFQNTKNHWNREIIRDEILNLVMESIIFTWSRVN